MQANSLGSPVTPPCLLFHAHLEMEKWLFCAIFTSKPEALKCRGGACWPTSHREFFILASPPSTKASILSSSWVQDGHADVAFCCALPEQVWISSSQPLTNMSRFVWSKWGIYKSKSKNKKENLTTWTPAILSPSPRFPLPLETKDVGIINHHEL